MNGKISSIKELCVDNREKLSEILRRCLVIAHEIGDNEFESFVEKEINGYKEAVPDYRLVKGRILAEDSYGRMLPIEFSNEDQASRFSKRAIGESIVALEALIDPIEKNKTLQITLPTGLKNTLRKAIQSDGDFTFEIQPSSIVHLIEQVRVKVLQWCISAAKQDAILDSFASPEAKAVQKISGKPRIFIGSSSESIEVAQNIQLELDHDADCTIWSQSVFQLSSTTLEDLIAKANDSDFAIFVFADDDLVQMRGVEELTVRDNVIFEFGLFVGILGKKRTFAVKPRGKKLHIPTDLWGITLGEYVHDRQDGNIQAALGPFCAMVRKSMKKVNS